MEHVNVYHRNGEAVYTMTFSRRDDFTMFFTVTTSNHALSMDSRFTLNYWEMEGVLEAMGSDMSGEEDPVYIQYNMRGGTIVLVSSNKMISISDKSNNFHLNLTKESSEFFVGTYQEYLDTKKE